MQNTTLYFVIPFCLKDIYRQVQTSTDSLTRKPEFKFKFSYTVFISKISHKGNCSSDTLAVEDHKRKKVKTCQNAHL